MSKDIEIVVARSIDQEIAAAMQRLVPQLSANARIPDLETLKRIAASPSTNLLIARDHGQNGKIVGSLTLVIFEIPTGVRAWIEDVVVDSEMRGRGVGQELMQEALRVAFSQGARTTELTSRPSREAANRLYQRLGFVMRESNIYRYSSKQ